MPPPPQVKQWLQANYPKPTVDPAWLEGCYDWIEAELHLDPANDMDEILRNVEMQLLQSNLSDSMLAGTGLPPDVAELSSGKIPGPPVLVEVVSMTEIGHSAFNLQNVRKARIERADLAGLAEQDDAEGGQNVEEQEDAGPIPKYPRSMLKFELSDGATTLHAIEYRRIRDFELGTTPLGYKMLLKNVFVRRGIAWLEPGNVVLKGYQTEERQIMQDADFVRGLRQRLGKPDEEPVAPVQNVAPIANARPRTPPPAPAPQPNAVRSPLLPIDEPPSPPAAAGPSGTNYDDDAEQPRRRKVPVRQRSPSPVPPPRQALTSSRFFGEPSSGSSGKKLAQELKLSPHRQGPLFLPDSDEERPGPSQKPPKFMGSKGKEVVVHLDDDVMVEDNAPIRNASPRSEDFDFPFEWNGELLEKLDQVEQKACGTAPDRPADGSPPRAPSGDLSVIEIDDDEEEGQEEKENVPVPTRHVRRRIVDDDDIIELSD